MRPAKRRGGVPELFRSRILISLPPYSPWVIGGGLAIAIFVPSGLRTMTNIVCLIAATVSVFCAYLVRRELRELRFRVHSILHDIDNDQLTLDDDDDNVTRFPTINIPKGSVPKVNGSSRT
jgi:hypothetical protein